ncbi:BsuBI/PstI family type II restriction endonuclease [Luteimicrobium xylanilyticum]|uniref:Uncharacterized protein n=1 Tax=Luteimicrobium xylanilyticum TaxID=1133546 RepID=A0A5P9QG13_9MICO|nr:BsuBI/PstI family type II restriction endonuclease [Luteimicrobium xylanilyticum]QFU99970.1 hypothetical protein KDY119_03506 [Luteimicrobium xylanilyticum]
MSLPAVVGRSECERRLLLVFPRETHDTVLSSPVAAAAVAAMLYVGAVVGEGEEPTKDSRVVRPSTCLWMQDTVLEARQTREERDEWFGAAARGKRALQALVVSWGLDFAPWYGDNSRETLRDEALNGLRRYGAVGARADLPTTSSTPRWALSEEFAQLFDPRLDDADLEVAIDAWRDRHVAPGDRLRISSLRKRQAGAHRVNVTLPDGEHRALEPGDASLLLQGVIEEWAARRLRDPVVLTISEPGAKVYVTDAAVLEELGLSISVGELLPDAVIVDIGRTPPEFWVVEVAATDGVVDDDRKARLFEWARLQGIDPGQLRFLTAFLSRNHSVAKRRLKDLAVGSHAWFLDEPRLELSWVVLDD